MMTLSSHIVQSGVASVRDVDEALARQAQYGGDLATNLLEISGADEELLTVALAESFGLEPAPSGELPEAAAAVRRLVPADVARRYVLYPLQRAGEKLIAAVAEPLPPEVVSDLEFSLGLGLEQRAATWVRVEEAIAREYGVALGQRAARLLARISGQPDPNPSVLPADGEPPRTPPAAGSSPGPAPPGPAEAPSSPNLAGEASESAPGTLGGLSRSPHASGRRRLGPFTTPMAERDLLRAKTRDEVVSAFFDFAAQFFEYSALFVVHGDLAEGRDAHGSGASRAKVRSIGVPLDLPSSLTSVVAKEPYRLTRLAASGMDAALLKDLERPPGPLALLLPVRVRGRTVLVLYGDHGEDDVALDAVGEVIAFVPLVVGALERVILRRKRLGLTPGVAEAAPRSAEPARSRPTPGPPMDPTRAPTPSATSRAPSLAQPVVSIGAPPRKSAPAFSEPPDTDSEDAGWSVTPPPLPVGGRAIAAIPPSVPLPAKRPGLSSQEPEEADPDRGWDDASLVVGHEARPLMPGQASDELGLPPVIVEFERDADRLITRLREGDTTALQALVDLGEAAVPALVGAFPGPITSELRRGAEGQARASGCGPVMLALARIGPRAAGVLGVRANDPDASVRAWATRLLGELPGPEAARTVATRFLDDDAEVRRAALSAGRMLQAGPEAGQALSSALSALLADGQRPDAARHTVIEAIADLREARAVPDLVALLADPSAEIRRSAHWALVVLTRTDYGESAAAWEQWWRVNATRHRIEWLIDALMHETQEIRRTAGDELKSLTKEYFGYYDDLSARERERAQQRYREWWETRGKAQFP